MSNNIEFLSKINYLGGVTAIAKLFGIRPQSVSGWLARGDIPSARMLVLCLLFPNLFPREDGFALDENSIKIFSITEDKISKLTKKIDIEILRESEDFAVIRKFFPNVLERSSSR